jgi:hypothetical protein
MRAAPLVAALLPCTASGGAWVREAGHLCAKISGSFLDASGTTILNGRGARR